MYFSTVAIILTVVAHTASALPTPHHEGGHLVDRARIGGLGGLIRGGGSIRPPPPPPVRPGAGGSATPPPAPGSGGSGLNNNNNNNGNGNGSGGILQGVLEGANAIGQLTGGIGTILNAGNNLSNENQGQQQQSPSPPPPLETVVQVRDPAAVAAPPAPAGTGVVDPAPTPL